MPEFKVAAAVPMPASGRPAKSSGASVRDMATCQGRRDGGRMTPPEKPPIFERLFGKRQSAEIVAGLCIRRRQQHVLARPRQPEHRVGRHLACSTIAQTAVYDISAHMVYLPDGTKLEAHSGLGSSLDDPRSASVRMRGVTPPHLYDLTPREALFHGVAALRLTPIGGENAIYGRSGLLAHTFMLGPNGNSNGCVSFRNYKPS